MNPWTHGKDEEAVALVKRVPKETTVLYTAQLKDVMKTNDVQTLWVEDVQLKVNGYIKETGKMNILLSLWPSVLTFDKKGEIAPMPIYKGKFNLEILFIYKHTDGDFQFHKTQINKKTVIEVNQKEDLQVREVEVPFEFLPTEGVLSLGLRLTPVDGPDNLTTFDGHFPIGDIQEIHTYQDLKVSADVIARAKDVAGADDGVKVYNRFDMDKHLTIQHHYWVFHFT